MDSIVTAYPVLTPRDKDLTVYSFENRLSSVGEELFFSLEKLHERSLKRKTLDAGTNLAKAKEAADGMVFCDLREGRRAIENVTAVTAIVLDFDNSMRVGATSYPSEHPIQVADAVATLQGLGLRAWVYTTLSHVDGDPIAGHVGWPRYRIILEPSRPMTVEEHGRIASWMVGLIGPNVDPCSTRASQLWLAPRRVEGRDHANVYIDGATIPVDDLVSWLPAAPAPKSKGSGIGEGDFASSRIGEYVEDLERVCGLVALLEIDGHRPVREEKGGAYLAYLSPFRDERTPSFKVEVGANRAYDYGSSESWHCQSYLQRTRGLPDFWATVDAWADLAGVPRFDRSKAGLPRKVDPSPIIDGLPEEMPILGRQALLEPALKAILTQDTLDQREPLKALAKKTSLPKKELDKALSELAKVEKEKAKLAAPVGPSSYAVIEGELCRVSGEQALKVIRGDVRHVETINVRSSSGSLSSTKWKMAMTPPSGGTIETTIEAKDFESMTWLIPASGGFVRVHPGKTPKTYATDAILSVSTPARRDVYRDMGWATVNGKRVFLHGGGAIGSADVQVQCEESKMGRYDLSGDATTDLEGAFASLDAMSRVAPASVMGPMLGTIIQGLLYDAIPLRGAHLIIGRTGSLKSSVALLGQQLLSTIEHATELFSLEGTTTALENIMHDPGNLPVVLDDKFPKRGRQAETQVGIIRTLLHTYYNGQARRRGTKDGGLKEERPPRCSLIVTTEVDVADSTEGESTSNRTVKSFLSRDVIDFDRLNEAQRPESIEARRVAMRAFVGALVAEPGWRETLKKAHHENLIAARSIEGLGDRQKELYAGLSTALEFFAEFARVHLPSFDVEHLRAGIVEALGGQTQETKASTPATRALDLLRQVLSSGTGGLCKNKRHPLSPISNEIGWDTGEEVHFEWDLVQKALNDLDRDAPKLKNVWHDLVTSGHALQDPMKSAAKGTRKMLGSHQHYRAAFRRSALFDKGAAPLRREKSTCFREDRGIFG